MKSDKMSGTLSGCAWRHDKGLMEFCILLVMKQPNFLVTLSIVDGTRLALLSPLADQTSRIVAELGKNVNVRSSAR